MSDQIKLAVKEIRRQTGMGGLAAVTVERIIRAAVEAETAAIREERLLLAKLAAELPQFYNPLEAMAAKTLRDRILSEAQGET